jgi:hypothetical protein
VLQDDGWRCLERNGTCDAGSVRVARGSGGRADDMPSLAEATMTRIRSDQ